VASFARPDVLFCVPSIFSAVCNSLLYTKEKCLGCTRLGCACNFYNVIVMVSTRCPV